MKTKIVLYHGMTNHGPNTTRAAFYLNVQSVNIDSQGILQFVHTTTNGDTETITTVLPYKIINYLEESKS